MTKESGQTDKKLAIIYLDGWSLSPNHSFNLFHPCSQPFFNSLIKDHRSVYLTTELDSDLNKTYHFGKNIRQAKSIAGDILANNLLWQQEETLRITDWLKKSAGRLWLFLPRKIGLSEQKAIDGIRATGLKKIGLLTLGKDLKHLPLLTKEIDCQVIINSIQFNSRTAVNPEDIILALIDAGDFQQFIPFLNKQKYSPCKIVSLTDELNFDQWPAIVKNENQTSFEESLANQLQLKKITINFDQATFDDLDQDLIIFQLPDNYFNSDLNWQELCFRRDQLIRYLLEFRLSAKYQTLISSRNCLRQQFTNQLNSLLPLVYLHSDKTSLSPRSTILEKHLNDNYSLADIGPTIYDYFDLTNPDHFQGMSLWSKLLPEAHLGSYRFSPLRDISL